MMSYPVICKIRDVAEKIVEANEPFYSADFLKILPDELLETGLNHDNVLDAEREIIASRHEKEWEFFGGRDERMNMPGYLKEGIKYIISDPDEWGDLSEDQLRIVKEILFLYALSDTVVQIFFLNPWIPNGISEA
jgi:hypothetical protein